MKTKISSDVINIDRFQSIHNKQWNSQNSKTYIYKWYGIRSHHWRLSLKWTSSNSCLSLYIQTHAHYTETESETGDGQNQTWLIFIYCFARRGCCFFFFRSTGVNMCVWLHVRAHKCVSVKWCWSALQLLASSIQLNSLWWLWLWRWWWWWWWRWLTMIGVLLLWGIHAYAVYAHVSGVNVLV